jgi:hypothetical protein
MSMRGLGEFQMFTIDDLRKAMSDKHVHAVACEISGDKYVLIVGFGIMFRSEPEANVPTHFYSKVEVTISKNDSYKLINPCDISGFLWGAYFDGVVGKYVPLQVVCDIVNFLRGDTSTSIKEDIRCQHCGKPNDHGSVQCWWCERKF